LGRRSAAIGLPEIGVHEDEGCGGGFGYADPKGLPTLDGGEPESAVSGTYQALEEHPVVVEEEEGAGGRIHK
jgi:hypothetical protein